MTPEIAATILLAAVILIAGFALVVAVYKRPKD